MHDMHGGRVIGLRTLVTMVAVVALLPAAAPGATCPAPGSGDFKLCYVDRTGVEIVMAWADVPGAAGYVVERSTSAAFSAFVSYTLPATVTGFGDTGWPITDFRRFTTPSTPSNSPTYHLSAGTDYYYRVRAGSLLSNVIGPHRIANFQHFSDVPRGISGDLWADVVLGRPRFGENTYWKTEPYHVQQAGGVLVDRNTSHPTRVFIADGNRSRILGMASLGACRGSGAPCSIDSDCDGDTCTLLPGQVAPQFVLGQPSDTDFGACNLDGTVQAYPNPVRPTASTLCFISPSQISIGETVSMVQFAVDRDHNLYVPDEFNHRVLMYRDPFNPANGTAAAAVWGQDSFETGLCNRGTAHIATANSLCSPNAVDIDAAGNLWVSDNAEANSRVLRFPYDPGSGTIATTADIILRPVDVNGAPILWRPNSVRVDPDGNVFVSSRSFVTKFSNPQPGQANPPQAIPFIAALRTDGGVGSGHLDFDPRTPGHLWVHIMPTTAVLVDLAAQAEIARLVASGLRGIGVSQAGDVLTTNVFDHAGLLLRRAGEVPPGNGPGQEAFLGGGVPTVDSFMSILGITIAGNQLLVSDRFAVHFWNDYRDVIDGTALTRPADGMWGLGPIALHGDSYFIASDESARIWILSRFSGLKIFASPLTATSVPIKTLSVNRYKDASGAIVPIPGGGAIAIHDILPIGSGNRVWIVDNHHARVVRVVNVDGEEAPGQPPYVDVVLGQESWAGTLCNKGGSFARDTFCVEGQLRLDAAGNFFVQENASGGGDGGFTRILRWDAGTIPDNPPQTLFNVLPDSVYGNGGPGNFTAPGCPVPETACTLRAPAFWGDDIMVVGAANPYAGSRQPMVYLNKDANYQPQFALGDVVSFPSASFVDPDGNLYLGDYNWNRVLVYKQPFAAFEPEVPGPTRTPTLTRTPVTPSPTPTPTLTPTPCTGSTSALSFDAWYQNVSVPDLAAFPSGLHAQLTIAFWFRIESGSAVLVCKHGAGANNQTFFLERWGQGFNINFANFTSVASTPADAFLPGEWVHVALVYDGQGVSDTDRLKIYVNGFPRPFQVFNAPIPAALVDSAAPLEIGGCAARTSFMWGQMDEVRLYNVALSESAIVAQYANGIGACGWSDEPGLVAGYHFDDQSGALAADYSGNGRHGTLVNGPLWVAGHVCCGAFPPTATPTLPPAPSATQPPTGTHTPSPTPTRTATEVASATPTLTPTPSVTVLPSLTPGGLCTSGAPANPCVPGGGPAATDCAIEWVLDPVPARNRTGIPTNRLRCYEGDPQCDMDPDLTNRMCRFAVTLCMNNADPRLSRCTSTAVNSVALVSPAVRSTLPSDVQNRSTLEAGLHAAFGVPVVRGRTIVFPGAPNASANQCGGPFTVLVALRTTAAGKAAARVLRISLRGTTSSGRRTADVVRLECRPSTCGDGTVQQHETCDDGNRSNGDGCDQGCRREP